MSSVIVAGDTSGSITISAPAVSGSSVLTLPAVTDTLVGKATTDTLTNKTLTSPTITGATMTTMASSVITAGTAVATTSGTSIDFTGIPSWVKRITVMLNGVSTNGTSPPQLQIGSGSALTSGYTGQTWRSNTNNVAPSTGFLLLALVGTAADATYGHAVLTNISSNSWAFSTTSGTTSNNTVNAGGGTNTTLGGTLDRIRLTTVNGSDTFDAGSINILYE